MIIIIFRKYKNNILLFFTVLFFSVFVNYIVYRLYNIYYINANTNFNNHSINFTISSSESDSESISRNLILPENKKSKVAIYTRVKESGMEFYKTLYSNYELNIISGEGFSNYSFENPDEHYAVIGSETERLIDISNIVVFGKPYKVRGIFKDNRKPSNNFTVYINDNSENISLNSVFILDGKNKREIENTFTEISESVSEQGFSVRRIEMDNVNLSYFLHFQKPIIIVFIFIILILIFSNFVVSVFWLYSCQRQIAVLTLVGKNFYFPIIKSYSICTLIANATGVLISLFLSRNSDMIWIGAVSFSLMEIFEILSIHAGMMYFSCKNTKDLLEIDYE